MTGARTGMLLATLALATAGCDESLRDLAGPTPNLEATFSAIQRDIFTTTDASGRTGCVVCHNPQLAAVNGSLNLEGAGAYAALVNAPSSGKPGSIRVIPGDPSGSYLVQKLEGVPGIVGVRMPFDGPPFLTSGQIAVIRRWIELGAANN
jgi:hypothetical protein